MWRLAFVTSPLLGLFGATPAFVFAKTEVYRLTAGFLTVTAMIFLFWAINVGLLWLFRNFRFQQKNWLRYLCSILICTLIMLTFANTITAWDKNRLQREFINSIPARLRSGNLPGVPKKAIIIPLLQSQSINIIIMVLMELVLLRARKQLVEMENTQLKMANLEARHGQLKQQLHPHFLFNSLSTLGALIRLSPERAENYLEKLSRMLRFSTDNNRTTISLAMELELCSNYMEMQQVRFGKALSFTIDVPGCMQLSGCVPVYSIQLLAENAIKHNQLTRSKPLHVYISGNPAKQTITVANNLQKKQAPGESIGVGLANLTERYRLLNKEEVLIHPTANEFLVTIKVLGNESGHY
jgi:two-component system, LytTR family, sensor kinase